MDEYSKTCSQVDAEFDAILGMGTGEETAIFMLIKAAARMIMTTYPDHRLRAMALIDLKTCAAHLKAIDAAHC